MLDQVKDWLTKELTAYVGGLSNPSKMPGFAYGLPATDCKTGGKLQKVVNSVCHGCYAMKGAYVWPKVRAAYERRAKAISAPLWVPAMAELIRRKSVKEPYFRWHDSGDLQSVQHFADICKIAELTPDTKHWLPTREYGTVTEYVESGGTIPDNLNVRLSAHMIGGHIPSFPRLRDLVTISTVSKDEATYPEASQCPARFQDNNCQSCRACWDRDVWQIDYHLH